MTLAEIMQAAFRSELAELTKEASPWGFVRGGLRGWGQLVAGGNSAARLGSRQQGGVLNHIGAIYRAGAKAAPVRALQLAPGHEHMMGARRGGVLGGLGALGRSRYGQMAGVAALGLGGVAVHQAYQRFKERKAEQQAQEMQQAQLQQMQAQMQQQMQGQYGY